MVGITEIHVSLRQVKSIVVLGSLGRARDVMFSRTHDSHLCLTAVVPAFAEPDIHSLSRVQGPSRKIESVFSASPETIRREPLE